MAVDISKSGDRIKITNGSFEPRCFHPSEIPVYGFSDKVNDEFVLHIRGEAPMKIALTNLRVSGGGNAPASKAAALTALADVFVTGVVG